MASTELELIRSALLPDESLLEDDAPSKSGPDEALAFRIVSTATPYFLEVRARAEAEDADAVSVDVKGTSVGRDEALEWKSWSAGLIREHWAEARESG